MMEDPVSSTASFAECQPMLKSLYELRQSSSLCDVCIIDDYGLALMAHSCILAAGSPVLKNMLLLKQTATMLRKQGLSVKIRGISMEVWDVLLQYLYLGNISMSLEGNMLEQVYSSAKMLGMSALEEAIYSYSVELGVPVDTQKEVDAINVTLAPTINVEHSDKGTQVDIPIDPNPQENQGSSKRVIVKEELLGDLLPLKNNAGSLLIPSSEVHQLVDDSVMPVRVIKTVHIKPYCIQSETEPNEITLKTLSPMNFSQSEVSAEQNQTQEIATTEVINCTPAKQKKQKMETKKNKIMRPIKNNNDDDNDNIEHDDIDEDDDDFPSIKPNSSSPESAEETISNPSRNRQPADVNLTCPNEACGESFNAHTQAREHSEHILDCLMTEGCKHPVHFASEKDGVLTYDDGLGSSVQQSDIELTATVIKSRPIKCAKQYKCSNCPITGKLEKMASHISVVHGKRKPYCCKECRAAYGYVESFLDHYVSHHTEHTLECKQCDRLFTKKDTLRRHVLMEHKRQGKRKHACSVCQKTFKYAHHARRHEQYHQSTSSRAHACAHCDKKFVTKQELERHTDVHSGVKSYLCSRCSFTSARRSNLIIHERKHGIVYGNFVCTTCDKYFMSESRFKSHITGKNHTGGHISLFLSDEITMESPMNASIEVVKAEETIDYSSLQCVSLN